MHILLTTDLSEESTRAFDPVVKLARRLGAWITLFHVVPDPTPVAWSVPATAPVAPPDPVELADRAKIRLGELRRRLPTDLAIEVEVEVGDPAASVIAKHARDQAVDYIAMATHGRSGIQRMLMGSIAEAVLREAKTPILLYPPAAE